LKVLENQHQIRQQTTTKFRIITIVNWNKYQDNPENPTAKATTGRQQSDTTKNYKKEKKESTAPLKEYFSSLCLEVQKHYAGSLKDDQRLREALEQYSPEQIKEMLKFYLGRSESRKVLTINAALSAVSLSYFEEAKSKSGWNEI